MKRSYRLLFGFIGVLIVAVAVYYAYGAVMRYLYPMKYSEIVEQYSDETGLDSFLVYAVIKCESNFNKDAVSYADAMGLMQLTEPTFVWIQSVSDGNALPKDALFDPDTNVRYGTKLLQRHLAEFGSIELALTAYHAGRGSVSKWLKDASYSNDGESLHTIPYDDTDAYVQRVLETKEIYQKLYG